MDDGFLILSFHKEHYPAKGGVEIDLKINVPIFAHKNQFV